MNPLKYTIEYHYPKSDKECHGDYWHIDILDPKGQHIRSFGDYYHDKGGEKAAAFLDGMQWALNTTFEVVHKQLADVEDYGDS